MNRIYKANKIYILKLAKVTEVVFSARKGGYTKSRNLPEVYLGKLIKTEKHYVVPDKHFFKLISSGVIVHDKHNHTNEGDLYVVDKTPLNMLLSEPTVFVDRKTLLATEKSLNVKIKNETEMSK